MKSESQIIDEIYTLEPDHARLHKETVAYLDLCKKMNRAGGQHEKACGELNAIAVCASGGDLGEAVRRVRFTHRENGLLMMEASRQLAKMAAMALSISEKLAAIVSTDGEDTP